MIELGGIRRDGSWQGCHGSFPADVVQAIREAESWEELDDLFAEQVSGIDEREGDGFLVEDDLRTDFYEAGEEWSNAVPQIRRHYRCPELPDPPDERSPEEVARDEAR